MAKKSNAAQMALPGLTQTAPAMPEGYYSGDMPNANLERFVEDNRTPYDPQSDDYAVAAFNEPITTTKATAIYNMHTYWSKKPHDAIRQYVRHYTRPGDLVLDPFCGSGGTALAALMEGRKALAIDRSPAATFITKNYCTPVDVEVLKQAFAQIQRAVQKEMDWLYETRCDRCEGAATTGYTVYSQVFQCPRCLNKVPLYDCCTVDTETAGGKPKKANACPTCFAQGHTEIIRSQSKKYGYIPVLVRYTCRNGCKPAKDERRHNDPDATKKEYFEKYDLAKLADIEAKPIPHWYPQGYDMTGFSRYQRDALRYYGVKEVADLFTKRNLWALAVVRAAMQDLDVHVRDPLLFGLTSVMLSCTRMYREREEGRGAARGGYYMPQVARDMVVPNGYSYKIEKQLVPGYGTMQGLHSPKVAISTQSATNLGNVPSNSVDYIFTDPPYSHTVQYGELNFVWEAWMGFDTHWLHEEIIVNETRGLSEADWASRMREAMGECYRVLKPGRWLSLCYHDTSEGTWQLIQDIMAEVGFVVDKTDSALFIDAGQKSYNQLTADKTTKRDLVINFRKPKPGEWRITQIFIPDNVDQPTFRDLGQQVIRAFLTEHPGASKDRVYDELVSHMVRKGQMEAHDFDALLRGVAEEVQEPVKVTLFDTKSPDLFGGHLVSRWYLKETADVIDQSERAREDAAAARLECFMAEYLGERPEREGVHYSDLFENYLPVADKPRRLLADFLPEYFFKTTSGTWRPPADDQERGQKAALRQDGTLRRIKRFANALLDGVPVREKDRPGSDRTLSDWVRQCRRAGLYEQGKVLYEKGGLSLERLGEQEQIEVEDDYRICVRRGAAQEGQTQRKGSRKKKQE